MSRKRIKLTLNDEQVTEPKEFIEEHPDDRIGVRASMVLDCGTGMTGEAVAEKYSERPCTVSLWKYRYAESGISGLMNQARGRTKDVYGKDFPTELMNTVHSAPPEGMKSWDVPSLAHQLDVPEYGVRRHLKKLGINLDAQNFLQGHEADEPAEQGPFDSSLQAEGGNLPVSENGGAPEDDPNMLEVSLLVLVKDKSGRQVMVRQSDLGAILADTDHFDVSTLSGFRRDYGRLEQGMITGFAGLMETFSADYTAEVSKKKQH